MQSKDIEIGANTYRLSLLPAKMGVQLLARVCNVLAGGAGGFSAQSLESLTDDAASGIEGSLFAALQGVAGNPKLGDHFAYFCDTFAEHTELINGDKAQTLSKIFTVHFAGNYTEMFLWLKECFMLNLGDFLAQIAARIAAKKAAKEAAKAAEQKAEELALKSQAQPGASG